MVHTRVSTHKYTGVGTYISRRTSLKYAPFPYLNSNIRLHVAVYVLWGMLGTRAVSTQVSGAVCRWLLARVMYDGSQYPDNPGLRGLHKRSSPNEGHTRGPNHVHTWDFRPTWCRSWLRETCVLKNSASAKVLLYVLPRFTRRSVLIRMCRSLSTMIWKFSSHELKSISIWRSYLGDTHFERIYHHQSAKFSFRLALSG